MAPSASPATVVPGPAPLYVSAVVKPNGSLKTDTLDSRAPS